MNKRHKIVVVFSVAVAGLALLNGAKISEGLGVIFLGASLAWVIGSQFVLRSSVFLWRHRIWFGCAAVLGCGALYGWLRYTAYQTERSENSSIAGLPAGAVVGPVVTEATPVVIPPAPDGSPAIPIQSAPQRDPNLDFSKAQPIDYDSLAKQYEGTPSQPAQPNAPPSTMTFDSPLSTSGQPAPEHQKRSARRIRALYDTNLTTTEYGSLKCGHIRVGTTATLLIDDGTFVKVKTSDGQIGWASSIDFELVQK